MEETNEIVELTYVPRYVKQVANYEYGDTLTHEAYNQLLNVNSTQGDYNTEVLDTLFNKEDSTYKIKYVDKKFTELDETISGITESIGGITTVLDNVDDALDTIDNSLANIEDGTTVVGHAAVADNLYGLVASGPNKYYGTDASANTGFFDVPEIIYCEDISSAVDFSGITITPAPNSVAESMLTTEVQTKLNRQAGVTDYDYLTSRPKINNVLLTGNVSIEDLGIQQAGDFVTNTVLNTTLNNYVQNTTLSNYMLSTDINTLVNGKEQTLNDSINSVLNVANSKNTIYIGGNPSNPKNGDLRITI